MPSAPIHPRPATFRLPWRRPWGIQNRLHWVYMLFREDESCIRAGHVVHNMAVLRRHEITAKGGIAARRKQTDWNDGYLFRVLSG